MTPLRHTPIDVRFADNPHNPTMREFAGLKGQVVGIPRNQGHVYAIVDFDVPHYSYRNVCCEWNDLEAIQ
jgi:hypothetical protein